MLNPVTNPKPKAGLTSITVPHFRFRFTALLLDTACQIHHVVSALTAADTARWTNQQQRCEMKWPAASRSVLMYILMKFDMGI